MQIIFDGTRAVEIDGFNETVLENRLNASKAFHADEQIPDLSEFSENNDFSEVVIMDGEKEAPIQCEYDHIASVSTNMVAGGVYNVSIVLGKSVSANQNAEE